MNNFSLKTLVAAVALCASYGVAAQNANTAPARAEQNRNAAERAADRTENAAERAANRTENAAERAADKTRNAADNAGDKTGSVMQDIKDAFSDSTLATKVKAALFVDDTTKARKIQVEAREGTVQLSGFVQTEEEKRQAEAVAQGVDGVQNVENDIRLSPGRN